MPITLTISENSKPPLRRLTVAIQERTVDREIGRAVVQLIKDNFHALPSNRHNFPSTGFWQRAAEATRYDLVPDGVQISVNQIGVRQRLLGGVINPRRGRFLTIPAIAETYGHAPADFGPLKIVRATGPSDHSTLALVPESLAAEKSNPINPGSVYFWLITSATQPPNPEVLPTDDSLLATALLAATNTLK
jgi:hypothetical protein